jgi:hypothetical protein
MTAAILGAGSAGDDHHSGGGRAPDAKSTDVEEGGDLTEDAEVDDVVAEEGEEGENTDADPDDEVFEDV